jgi:hypothetical protein
MTEDVPPRGRASHSLAVYHVPDNTLLTPPEGLPGKIKPNTFTLAAAVKFVARFCVLILIHFRLSYPNSIAYFQGAKLD